MQSALKKKFIASVFFKEIDPCTIVVLHFFIQE